MNGRPVWLASVTFRDKLGEIRPTPTWFARDRDRAQAVLDELLRGVGDQAREVSFRMNLSLCRHRGLNEEEEAELPESFHSFRATDSAGTAVEVLWKRGVTGLAVDPCERPGRRYLADRPHYWLPEPCGECPPCLAREAVVA